jgi:hypothetical protein
MGQKIKFPRALGHRRVIVIIWPFLVALIVFLWVRIAIGNPDLVEKYYSKEIYPFIARLFSGFSRLIPFSLWDIFWIIFILLIITGLILVIIRKMKPGKYILRLGQSFALIYSLFYMVWGFNYFRPGIGKRIGWETLKTEESVFRSILDSIIVNSNSTYIGILVSDYSVINTQIEESYYMNSSSLGISYPNGKRRPKTMVFSSFFAKAGVNGYFGPFFNEIHLDSFVFPMEYPFVLAHEKSHQFGIAKESEANLAAFVVCITSPDRRLKYSGYTNLLLYFLSDAAHLNDYKDYIKKIDKRVLLDLQLRRKYYQGIQKEKLHKVQVAANNAYLKTNHIKQGIRNYNEVVSLVIGWYNNRTKANKNN